MEQEVTKMTAVEKDAEIARLRERVTDLQGKLGEQRDAKLSQRVRKFMLSINQEVKWTPAVPEQRVVALRAKLIFEECLEMLAAMYGPTFLQQVIHEIQHPKAPTDKLTLEGVVNWLFETTPPAVDLPELADALSDMRVVIVGTDAAFGINGDAVDTIVMDANDLKLTGPVAPSGKRLKPEGWQPPDVAGLLRKAGWQDAG